MQIVKVFALTSMSCSQQACSHIVSVTVFSYHLASMQPHFSLVFHPQLSSLQVWEQCCPVSFTNHQQLCHDWLVGSFRILELETIACIRSKRLTGRDEEIRLTKRGTLIFSPNGFSLPGQMADAGEGRLNLAWNLMGEKRVKHSSFYSSIPYTDPLWMLAKTQEK